VSIEDLVVRGLQGGGINTEELVAALRAMYGRVPAAANSTPMESGFTPGLIRPAAARRGCGAA
jgi:hypothetical protein